MGPASSPRLAHADRRASASKASAVPRGYSSRARGLGSLVADLGGRPRVRLVAAAALPDRGEQAGDLLALTRVEPVEQLVLDAVHRLRDLVDHREPLLRDLHQMPAPVLGIAAASRVAALLELVQDRDEVRGIEVQLAAKGLLGELTAVAQLDQRGDMARAD